jgi:HSP20 family protein
MAIIRRGEVTPPVRRSREWDPFQTMRELIGWDPFQEMSPRLWRGEEGIAFVPAFDVRETKDAYIFNADLPGFRDQDIDINVTGSRLLISGKREAEQEAESDTYYSRERSYGSFARSFTLPEGTEPDRIQADLKDGVLTLHVPKRAESQPRRIELRRSQTGEKKAKA